MKKRASANKSVKKPAARAAGRKPTSGRSSGTAPRTSRSEKGEVAKVKYTPAPLKTDGWPAFRYPLP